MSISKQQSISFLNRELRDKAQALGLTRLPEQATINLAEAAKVRIKNVTSRRP